MNENLQARITAVQAQYAHDLMEKAHVVGVGIGLAKINGEYTDQLALIVMVSEKVPVEELDFIDRIPSELEGVRVDVQAVGQLQAF